MSRNPSFPIVGVKWADIFVGIGVLTTVTFLHCITFDMQLAMMQWLNAGVQMSGELEEAEKETNGRRLASWIVNRLSQPFALKANDHFLFIPFSQPSFFSFLFLSFQDLSFLLQFVSRSIGYTNLCTFPLALDWITRSANFLIFPVNLLSSPPLSLHFFFSSSTFKYPNFISVVSFFSMLSASQRAVELFQ